MFMKGETVFMFAPNTVLIGFMTILDFELFLELDNYSFSCGADCSCRPLLIQSGAN